MTTILFEKGFDVGFEEGYKIGFKRGFEEGEISVYCEEMHLSPEDIAKKMSIPVERVIETIKSLQLQENVQDSKNTEFANQQFARQLNEQCAKEEGSDQEKNVTKIKFRAGVMPSSIEDFINMTVRATFEEF